MYRDANASITMAELDRRLGYSLEPVGPEAADALRWYARMQDRPLPELSDEDITVALENDPHLPAMIPLAVTRLKTEPLAGMLYEGQLMPRWRAPPGAMRPLFPDLAVDVREALGELRPKLPPTLHPLLDEAWHKLAAQE